ncbi:L-histidine N(alpha)-methyltransferase [Candidatus Bathyarchaeota archaeon]|nr:L-histidine N(alpha)-methyltransferase [Candidatus Bathyarchaeota archaeon]
MITKKTINTTIENKQFLKDFKNDVLKGLSNYNKSLPCKYIYDEEGSKLFKKITKLPEYYLTRSELQIFSESGNFFGNLLQNLTCNIIEFGVGDGQKTRILLKHLTQNKIAFRYYPIDISSSAMADLINTLKRDFKNFESNGIVADYSCDLTCLRNMKKGTNLVLFLGSNIGNMNFSQSIIFLRRIRRSLNVGDYLLIGFDLKKDSTTLQNAYNDSQGISEKFNKNLLNRINIELGGNFDLNLFSYLSIYDLKEGAIVSKLVSKKQQLVKISSLNKVFSFTKGETIHTESSYKYDQNDIQQLAKKSGFSIIESLYDKHHFFTNSLWQPK